MRIPPRWLLAAAVILVVVFAYPGYLDATGLAQLRLMQHWRPSPDAYGFTILWRLTALLVAGPFGMVLAQVALFTYGAHGILRREVGERATTFTALLLVLPPVLVGISTVAPMSLTAALFMAAAGTERAKVRRATVVLAVICTPVAVLAAIPLLLFYERRSLGLVMGAGLLALAAVLMIVTVDADQARTDLRGMHAGAELQLAPPIDAGEPYAHRVSVVKMRSAARSRHVGDFIAARGQAFKATLIEGNVPSRERPGEERRAALKLGVPTGTSFLQRFLIMICRGLAHTPLMWPALYALAALVLLFRYRSKPSVRALLVSGLLLELAMLLGGGGSLWLVSTALIGALATKERA